MAKAKVFLFIILAPAWVWAQQTQVPPELIQYPETILHNGKILTVDANFRIAEAVAIRNGVFSPCPRTRSAISPSWQPSLADELSLELSRVN